MEEGRWDEGNEEQERLEEKQSSKGKGGGDYNPVWFKRESDEQNGGQDLFTYQGGYWEAKEKQEWNRCPDIF